jgi:hypothetical protein
VVLFGPVDVDGHFPCDDDEDDEEEEEQSEIMDDDDDEDTIDEVEEEDVIDDAEDRRRLPKGDRSRLVPPSPGYCCGCCGTISLLILLLLLSLVVLEDIARFKIGPTYLPSPNRLGFTKGATPFINRCRFCDDSPYC